MLVVIALAAILATIVAVSLSGSFRSARAGDVVGQISTCDRLAREHARRFGRPVSLRFDLDRGTLVRLAGDGSGEAGGTLQLPSGLKFVSIVTPGRNVAAGQVSIPISTRGQAPSYAIILKDPAGRISGCLIAGLTGDVSAVKDERETQDIFKLLAGPAGGDDAR